MLPQSYDKKSQVDKNDVAEVIIKTDSPIAFDLSVDIANTSRFVIVDNYEISGGGIIEEALEDEFAQIQYGGNHSNNELCFIKKGLIESISSFFSLNSYQSTRIVGQWVKKKLNLEGQMSNKIMSSQWSLKLPSEN